MSEDMTKFFEGIGYDPKKEEVNSLIKDLVLNPPKKKYKCEQHPFADNAAFIHYVKCAILKKSPLKQNELLSLLYYRAKKLEDITAILPEILEKEIEILSYHGMFRRSGNGKNGLDGLGPIVYEFIPTLEDKLRYEKNFNKFPGKYVKTLVKRKK